MNALLFCLVLAASPDLAPAATNTAAQAEKLGRMLQCPSCQGLSIAESQADVARDMMVRVRELLEEGKSEDEVLDYFVARYGEWVLLRPRATGLGLALWVAPGLSLLAGLWLASRAVRQRQTRAAEVEADAPYIRAVREEVRR